MQLLSQVRFAQNMCSTCGARLCLSAMLSKIKGTKQNTKHRKTIKHIRVTLLNSPPSSPEAAAWDEEGAALGLVEVSVWTTGGGLLVVVVVVVIVVVVVVENKTILRQRC